MQPDGEVPEDGEGPDQLFRREFLPAELDAIRERREVARAKTAADQPAGEPEVGDPAHPQKDLVGLSLSGGGVRSAMFNLGLLHAFYNERAIRHVDVLATVSGGTYVGTYLSTLAVGRENFFDRTNHPLVIDPHTRPTKDVLAFTYAGRYLFKPLHFASRYLQGLVLTNWVLLSMLMFAAATTAFLWRLFDLPEVRAWTGLAGLGSDLQAAFLPAMACVALWVAVGAFRWAARRLFGLRAGRVYRGLRTGLFGMTVACVAIGVAVALSNADLGLNEAMQRTFGVQSVRGQSYLRWPLFVLLALMIVPLVRGGAAPKAAKSSSRWHRAAWELCLWAATVGVALAWVAWFAQEDFALHAATRSAVVEPADVKEWDGLAKWASEFAATPGLPEEVAASLDDAACLVQDAERERRDVEVEIRGALGEDRSTRSLPRVWRGFVAKCLQGGEGVAALRRAAAGIRDQRRVGLARGVDAILDRPELHKALEKQLPDLRRPAEGKIEDLDALIARLAARPSGEAGAQQSEADAVREGAARAALIRRARLAKEPDAALARVLGGPTDRAYGRALLELCRPDLIKPLRFTSTPLVAPYDETARLWWMLGTSLSALAALLLVPMNAAASVFWFYRSRLRDTFMAASAAAGEQDLQDARDPKLHKLKTTAKGAPYHVIVASDSKVFGRGNRHEERHRFFTFSHLFVGSPWPNVGYAEADKYLGGSLRVSEAMALSGAAVSPTAIPDWRLTLALFALNLRLGQWLPRPGWNTDGGGRWEKLRRKLQGRGRDILGAQWLWATLSRDNGRLSPNHLFIADGGYRENLGLEQLLLRRCKVAVVSDAGTDPDGASDNLANAIHLARVGLGVRIINYDPHAPVLDWDKPLDVSALSRGAELSASHMALGLILYPPADPAKPTSDDVGVLIYLKSSLTGDEDVDVRFHKRVSPTFPYDTTLEQFYDERRVEAYRELGYHIGLQGGATLKEMLTKLRAGPAWPPAPPPQA